MSLAALIAKRSRPAAIRRLGADRFRSSTERQHEKRQSMSWRM
jgi:hypothetical protein